MVMGQTWLTANSFWFWHLPLGLSNVFPFWFLPGYLVASCAHFSFLWALLKWIYCFDWQIQVSYSSSFPFAVHGSHQFRLFATACHVQYSPPVNNSRQCCGVLKRGRQGPYTLHHFNFDGPTYLLLLALMLCWHGHIHTYILHTDEWRDYKTETVPVIRLLLLFSIPSYWHNLWHTKGQCKTLLLSLSWSPSGFLFHLFSRSPTWNNVQSSAVRCCLKMEQQINKYGFQIRESFKFLQK